MEARVHDDSPLPRLRSSSPLSVLSKSPSPPPSSSSPLLGAMDPAKRYPSPSSTAQSGSSSPLKLSVAPTEIEVRPDGGPPPPKRRKLQQPKQRTTEYLDLGKVDQDGEEQLDRLLAVLRKKKKIVVIAGAGISVSAGIPDFRSSTGLFASLRGQHGIKGSGKHLFDASVYKNDKSTSSFHQMVRDLAHQTQNAKPTPFHHLLASLAHEGRLMRLYSQNVDCIETSMPPLTTTIPLNSKAPWPITIQLHGGLEKMVCTKCGQLESFKGSLFEGPEPPPCPKCEEHDQVRTSFGGKRSHGIGRLRPRIVLYNEDNPDADAIGNVSKADLRRVPDAVIVVGTSMKIPGLRRIAKEMCQVTRSRRDGFTAWINIDPEPQGVEFKDCWDLVVRAKCDDIAQLANLPQWDEQDIGVSWKVTGDSDKEERLKQDLSREEVKIVLDAVDPLRLSPSQTAAEGEATDTIDHKSRLLQQTEAGIPTPSASPRLRTALPSKPTKGQLKQSKLSFAGKDAKPGPEKTATKAPRPRKPKNSKQPTLPKSNLSQTFRATKILSAAEAKTPSKPDPDPNSSDLSSPPEQLDSSEYWPGPLPPLRDFASRVASLPAKAFRPTTSQRADRPSTPPPPPVSGHRRTPSADTISPTSKPRSMDLLID